MKIFLVAGVLAFIFIFLAKYAIARFNRWQFKKLMAYNDYFCRYMACSPEETIRKHTRIVVGVYAFCPHCFSTRVYAAGQENDVQWHCSDCGAHSGYGSMLPSLIGWHRQNYIRNLAGKVEHGQANS